MTAAQSTVGGWLMWELEAVPICPRSREHRARALAGADRGQRWREPVQLELFEPARGTGAAFRDQAADPAAPGEGVICP
jgi:hypothetical protein